jgi:hypothetical protein
VRAWALLLGGGALVAIGGCTVGQGSGSAGGSLWVIGCSGGANYGLPDRNNLYGPPLAAPYQLGPSFFAAIPMDDFKMGQEQMNQISIRMQSSGLEIVYTDTLYFDVQNSYEVARCLRGAITKDGQPDYLVTEPLPLSLAPAGSTGVPRTLWCDWTGTAFTAGGPPDAGTPGPPDAGASLDGGMSVTAQYPRIHLTPYTDLHSSIGLLQTCPTALVVGDAIDGWIQFENFGAAEQPNLAPDQRTHVPSGFVINYGDRMSAHFHVVLGDSQVVTAIESNTAIPTQPLIGGTLDGYFDFELARGRAGQPFP